MVYSSSNLKTALKSGAGSKPHDVQEALKKKQVLNTLQQEISIFTFFIYWISCISYLCFLQTELVVVDFTWIVWRGQCDLYEYIHDLCEYIQCLTAFYWWKEFSPLIGGNETPARYEEKEAGDVRKTNRMPEGKSGMWLVNAFCFCGYLAVQGCFSWNFMFLFLYYCIDVDIQAGEKQGHETRRESRNYEDFKRTNRKNISVKGWIKNVICNIHTIQIEVQDRGIIVQHTCLLGFCNYFY